MSWTDFFRSRYVRFLESELAALRKRHAEELETQKNLYLNQISSCILEANRGWAEADRLRIYLVPGLPTTTRQTESTDKEPPAMDNTESGTPWQRMQARWEKSEQNRLAAEAAAKTEADRAKQFPTAKPVQPAEEKQNAPSN